MIEARKKGLGQNLGVYDSVAHVWIHDDLRLKITSEKDEGNSYKKFPQLLRKTMASPYSVTSLE